MSRGNLPPLELGLKCIADIANYSSLTDSLTPATKKDNINSDNGQHYNGVSPRSGSSSGYSTPRSDSGSVLPESQTYTSEESKEKATRRGKRGGRQYKERKAKAIEAGKCGHRSQKKQIRDVKLEIEAEIEARRVVVANRDDEYEAPGTVEAKSI